MAAIPSDANKELLRSRLKPKEKRVRLVDAVCKGQIPVREFLRFFEGAPDPDKGSCADALKHISEKRPELLRAHIDMMIPFINYRAPRVRWGIQEAIGNLAKRYPARVATAVPRLLRNTTGNSENTTVIRWCAAYALSEILKHNPDIRKGLLPRIRKIAEKEQNNGVKGVYLRMIRTIEKEHVVGTGD